MSNQQLPDEDNTAPAPVANSCPEPNCKVESRTPEGVVGHVQTRHGR